MIHGTHIPYIFKCHAGIISRITELCHNPSLMAIDLAE